MLKKYEELNLQAKDYLIVELENIFYEKYNDKELLERCYKEINILYNKGFLFIVEHLYKYKKQAKDISYYFSGSANNLFILYLFELTKVNPIKYNLPYELFNDRVIKLEIDGLAYGLLYYFQKCDDFKIVSGYFEKEDIEEINEIEKNHYLLIPDNYPLKNMLFRLNNIGMFETVDDYREYKDNFIAIRIAEKKAITKFKNVGLENVICNKFERQLSKILNPKTIEDYVKIKSLARGANVWKCNQDLMVKNNILNLKSIISNREDIYEYLIAHSISSEVALEIIKFLNTMHIAYYHNIWGKYVDIMKQNKCEDRFIDIIEAIDYVSYRGQAISECLFALDKANYYNE